MPNSENFVFDDNGKIIAFAVDYAEYDKDGNLIEGSKFDETSKERIREGDYKNPLEELNPERSDQGVDPDELEMSEGGIREKPPHDPDKAPVWTEVRGMTSFYYICGRCGAMVPGTGPQLEGPDGKKRTPKEQHENWHTSQLIDWFDDE